MKVLVTGDWHIGVSSFGIIDESGKNSRLQDFEDAINRSIDIALNNRVDLYICAGDIFHTNKPSVEEQRVFFRILQRLEALELKSRFIIGNHDFNSKIGSSHALKLFMDLIYEWRFVKIYDQTSWELFSEKDEQMPLLICFYPYHGEDPDLRNIGCNGPISRSALVCHSHLEGAIVGAEPFEIKSDTATKFKHLPFNFIWAGHFHKPQKLSDIPLAIYPGSICPVDFNERNDVKGVVLVNTLLDSYECAAIRIRDLYQIDLDWTVEKKFSFIENEVNGNIVKVKVRLLEEQVQDFDEEQVKKSLLEAGAHSIASINFDVVKKEIRRNSEIRLDHNLIENVEKYLDMINVGPIRDKLLVEAKEIINESSCNRS